VRLHEKALELALDHAVEHRLLGAASGIARRARATVRGVSGGCCRGGHGVASLRASYRGKTVMLGAHNVPRPVAAPVRSRSRGRRMFTLGADACARSLAAAW
jgi:hypothetical protein